MNVKSLVVTGFGINCEDEMAAAYKLSGAKVDIVHLTEVFQGRTSIHDYHILNFPGGFSFGDDLGAAKVLGNKIKYRKMASGKYLIDEINKFIQNKNYIIGVCNGFQALVKMGLLPNISGNCEQEASLTHNNSGKFEDRWVTCGINEKSNNPFLTGITQMDLPVRHGEGKLMLNDENIANAVKSNHLNCLSYLDENNQETMEYPANPNGSDLSCAGLIDKSGQVFGLMPHPEAFLALYNHPNWQKMKRNNPGIDEEGQGLELFKNIVEKIKNN
jgi:phosphoribosylformylglycinamidine synthase